jgi:N-acetylmuramoyl-L-alanine amidase
MPARSESDGTESGMHTQDPDRLGPVEGARSRAWHRWLRSRAWWLALLLAVVTVSAVQAKLVRAEATVRAIRIAEHGEGTRVVIDLSRRVEYRHIPLNDPSRLAIDLPDVAWLVPESNGRRSVGLVKGFRFGRFQPGVSRLVLDLDGPFEIRRVFELPPNGPNGYRIVTDLAVGINGAANDHQASSAGQQTAALRVPGPAPQPQQAPRPGKRLIVIDPGHGGIDPGAIGAADTYEKNVVLAMGLELRRQLIATGRYEVVMTRDDDSFVRLRDRLQIARESQGELFISLHADSLRQAQQVAGLAIYTLSERASNEEAARLAQKENRADILGGVDLSDQEDIVTQILIDLAQRDANNKSIRIAELMVDELADVTRMLRRQRQQAGFVVLKSPDMPSVLIELGYLSNPKEEQALRDSGYLARLATALVRAIDRYFAPAS